MNFEFEKSKSQLSNCLCWLLTISCIHFSTFDGDIYIRILSFEELVVIISRFRPKQIKVHIKVCSFHKISDYQEESYCRIKLSFFCRSLYRELLYLALTSCGVNNIEVGKCTMPFFAALASMFSPKGLHLKFVQQYIAGYCWNTNSMCKSSHN